MTPISDDQIAALVDAADEWDRYQPAITPGEVIRQAVRMRDAIRALASRVQSDAAVIAGLREDVAQVRKDRLAELGHFIAALFEWGAEDPREVADEVRKFLASPIGLEAYREVYDASLSPPPVLGGAE